MPRPDVVVRTPSPRLNSRGVNVSRWFRFPADDSESHALSFITDADLDLLKFLGVSVVRLAVAPAQLLAPGMTDCVDPRRLAYIDRAVALFISRGLFVVLQYHDETRAMETSMSAVDAFERLWIALARHFGDFSPDTLALEILNEPVFDRAPRAWFPIQRRIVAAVRAAAPHHTIVTGGPHWSSLDGLLMSAPLDHPNIVYTFHFYEPFDFTHQGALWADARVKNLAGVRYPATVQEATYIERRIASAGEWAARHGVPVWAGEFGAYPPAAPRMDRLRWLHDVRTALERHAIGWAVWSYDESLGLDRRLDANGRVTIDWDSAAALGLRTPGQLA